MPEVCVTGVAGGLDACAPEAVIVVVGNYVGFYRLCKRGPAAARLKLLLAVEQQCAAADAGVVAGLKARAHLVTERTLRAGLAGDVVLFRREQGGPLLIAALQPCIRFGIAFVGEATDFIPGEHGNNLVVTCEPNTFSWPGRRTVGASRGKIKR